MSERYEAIIFGRRREILGWTADGHLQLSHARLELEFVDIKPEGKIRRIASYHEQLLHTSIDGQWFCPQDLCHMRRDDNRRAIEAAMGAFCSYPPNVQHCIVAVAWSGDNAWHPHVSFLTRCEEKPAAQSVQSPKTVQKSRTTPKFKMKFGPAHRRTFQTGSLAARKRLNMLGLQRERLETGLETAGSVA